VTGRPRVRRAGTRLALLALAAGGCSRMVIGHLPIDAGADRKADTSHPDTPNDSPVDPAVEVRPDAQAIPDAGADARDDGGSRADAKAGDDGSANADADGGAHADASANPDLHLDTPPDRPGADAPPEAIPPPPVGIIGGRVTMSDTLGVRNAGVAGVRITLGGAANRGAISDANGAYAFPGLPPGSYTLTAAKDGATFTPASAPVVVGAGADAGAPAGVVASFGCTAPCGTGPAIDPARELYIIDPSVITDARSSNASGGPWSFRFLMEQAATLTPPSRFAEVWVANLETSGRSMAGLRSHWPTVVENTERLLDLSRAPFGLLAIVNGVDAHSAGQGEARLVYGIYDSGTNGTPQISGMSQNFTVMFRYALPATPAIPTRQAWAARFHELAATPFGPDYNAKLQALTDIFTRAFAVPASFENPRGSALIAVSINEGFQGNSPAQFHESRLLLDPVRGAVTLAVSTLEQTPDPSLNGQAGDGPLADFINANAVLVQTGQATLPAALLGKKSSAFDPPAPWSFPSVTSEPLRHAFAGQTCVGCHSSEVPIPVFTVFHILPFSGPAQSSLGGYLPITEIPRRISFMQNQLTCTAPTCALGAEPMMGPQK